MNTTALPLPSAPNPAPRRSGEGVLSDIRSARAAITSWEVEAARLVLDWIEGHRVPEHLVEDGDSGQGIISFHDHVTRSTIPGMQAPMQLAGPGAPLVWDLPFCELATSLTMSPDAARGYVGEIAELGYRLPELWSRVDSGQVRLWRAREVARNTTRLCADGARWVDKQVAAGIGSCSGAQLRRTMTAALQRFDPEAAEVEQREAADGRYFSVLLDAVAQPEVPGSAGVVGVEGLLDTADALDLDAAVAGAAAHLEACGSTESRNVRRARALGEMARREATLPLAEHSVDREPGTSNRAEEVPEDSGGRNAATPSIEPPPRLWPLSSLAARGAGLSRPQVNRRVIVAVG